MVREAPRRLASDKFSSELSEREHSENDAHEKRGNVAKKKVYKRGKRKIYEEVDVASEGKVDATFRSRPDPKSCSG